MSTPRFLVWEETRAAKRIASLYHGELPRDDSDAARGILKSYRVATPQHDALGLDQLQALPCYACPPAPAEPAAPIVKLGTP